MNFNHIKNALFCKGGINNSLIFAMHCTEKYKLLKDELSYYVNSRNLLRDELLNVYRFLDDLDMFEAYLDNRNFTSTTKNDKSDFAI